VYWLVLIGLFVGTLWMGWTFRASNSLPVDLELIWVQLPHVELWFIILVAMAVGASLSGLFFGFAWLRQRLLSGRYRRAIRRLEAELHEMRSLPLSGPRASRDEVEGEAPGVGEGVEELGGGRSAALAERA